LASSPLIKLLTQRKVVRNYIDIECSIDQLLNIPKNAIKIPTAGFSRGIEILISTESENILEVSKIFGEIDFVSKGLNPWISKSKALYFILVNEEAYHQRYEMKDKTNAINSKNWDVPYWYLDAGAAMMNCMLLIEESNFSSGFMGLHNINRDLIHDLFKIPLNYKIAGLVTAGISENKNQDIINKKNKKKLTHYEFFSK
jgi:nitroreductase